MYHHAKPELFTHSRDHHQGITSAVPSLTSLSRIGGILSSPLVSQSSIYNGCENSNPMMIMPGASIGTMATSHPLTGLDEERVIVPNKRSRKISKIPYKVLDAPALQDDFYLNLVDWSSCNNLAVGLSNCIYIWSASNSKVTKLHDLG